MSQTGHHPNRLRPKKASIFNTSGSSKRVGLGFALGLLVLSAATMPTTGCLVTSDLNFSEEAQAATYVVDARDSQQHIGDVLLMGPDQSSQQLEVAVIDGNPFEELTYRLMLQGVSADGQITGSLESDCNTEDSRDAGLVAISNDPLRNLSFTIERPQQAGCYRLWLAVNHSFGVPCQILVGAGNNLALTTFYFTLDNVAPPGLASWWLLVTDSDELEVINLEF